MLKTLIELMIMGGRIWKTDDSVSTRDFSFLSDISLPVLTGELHSTHTVVVFLDKLTAISESVRTCYFVLQ